MCVCALKDVEDMGHFNFVVAAIDTEPLMLARQQVWMTGASRMAVLSFSVAWNHERSVRERKVEA